MKYPKKLIFDYISGNDIENYSLDELEDDYEFMIEVIKLTKDKRIYNLCTQKVKNNYNFVKFIIETFKEDIPLIIEVSENYLSKTPQDDITHKELIIILNNIKSTELSNKLDGYKATALVFYLSTIIAITKAIKDRKITDLGRGFYLIQENYKTSPLIVEYMAKRLLFDIFYNTDDKITLEEIIHINYKDKKALEKYGISNFIISHITSIDEYLGAYISAHTYLIEKIKEDIKNIIKKWDIYMNKLNARRIDIVYRELKEYDERNIDEIDFSIYEVFDEVVIEQKLEKLFQIPFKTTEELENSLDKKSSLKRKILKNNISKLIKDIFKYDYLPKEIPEDKFRLEVPQNKNKVIDINIKKKKNLNY